MRPDNLRVPVGVGSTHIERYGHGGVPIILLHGFGTCAFLWRNVAAQLANGGHTAYAMDLFGYGESDRTTGADLSITAQSEYVDAAMTSLRLSRAILVGNDLGALVGLKLAATRPERVAKLVMINPPDIDDLPPDDVVAMQRSTAKFAFRLPSGILGAAPLIETILLGSVSDPANMPTRLIARYLAPYAGMDGVKHLLTLGAAIKEEDFESVDLADIATPSLVIRGREDQWVDESAARSLQNSLPNCDLEIVDKAGRLIPEEAPDWLVARLMELAVIDKSETLTGEMV